MPHTDGMFTARLDDHHHLRLFEESDAPELFAVVAANRDYLSRWMPWAAVQTEAGTLEFIQASRRQFAASQGFQAAIIAGEHIVGTLGFHRLDWENRYTNIGYWIAEDAQGQGIATRAAGVLVEYAVTGWGMNRIELRAGVENTRSRRVAERLGFTYEGVLRQAERVGERYIDHAVYSVLASEWRERADTRDAPLVRQCPCTSE
ncbi:MAG: GNAT family protein [Solirubrobacteraceae bacterium]